MRELTGRSRVYAACWATTVLFRLTSNRTKSFLKSYWKSQSSLSEGTREVRPNSTMRALGQDVRGGQIADSGHYIAEEQPGALAKELLKFFQEVSP